MKKIFLGFFLLLPALVLSQSSVNVSLFGQIDPAVARYSGSWAYTSPQGAEYALIGGFEGLSVVPIDDSTNLYQADFVPGPSSRWREITVIDQHAYVVTEGDSGDTGMQVIFLGSLPDSVQQVTTFDSTFVTGHIIEKDILGDPNYVYVCGTNPQSTRGVHIIDVSNPAQPVEVSTYAPDYAHDCHVRGDTMYVSAIFAGYLDVVDISDKANPVRITQLVYPNAFTHSCWTTQDNSHLLVMDEIDGLPARIHDITDLSNIQEVAQWTANEASLVHNAYIREDFAFIAHNTEGLRVLDLRDPAVPVEVGHYDTWAGPSGGFDGLWSACPFFPSGKIIGANRHDGLYVWRFNDAYAGRIYGLVRDSLTLAPITNAEIRILPSNDTVFSRNDGGFAYGALPGGYILEVAKPGYFTKTITTPLAAQDSLWFTVDLASLASATVPPSTGELQLLPGPGGRGIQAQVPEAWREEGLELRLYDVQGRRLTAPIPLEGGRTVLALDQVPRGVLIYEFWRGDARLKAGRFVGVGE